MAQDPVCGMSVNEKDALSLSDGVSKYCDGLSKTISLINLETPNLIKELSVKVNGEWLQILSTGYLMHANALFHFAEQIFLKPEVKLFYGDHDLISLAGKRHSPNFKPDHNPDLFYNNNYINDSVIFNRKRLNMPTVL